MPMNMESFSVKEHETAANSVEFTQKMNSLKKRIESNKSTEEELQKVAKEFEAIFLSQIWQQMRSTVPKEGYMTSKQEDMYMSMFDKEFSEHLAEGGGIGLQDMLYQQLKQNLENAGTPGRSLSDGRKDLPSLRDDKNLTSFIEANKLSPIGQEEENDAESFGFTPVENPEELVYSIKNTGDMSENGKTNTSQNITVSNGAIQQSTVQNESIANNARINETISLNKIPVDTGVYNKSAILGSQKDVSLADQDRKADMFRLGLKFASNIEDTENVDSIGNVNNLGNVQRSR